MIPISYTTIDKAGWPCGVWHDEPDKMQWPDESTGFPCLAVRSWRGYWCGYVGVQPEHPWHGIDYGHSDVDADVHGGLTFAGVCRGTEATGICHVTGDGEPDDVWWFGFDCSHYGDLGPLDGNSTSDGQSYKWLGYVRSECARLASQLKAVAPRLWVMGQLAVKPRG